MPNSLELNVSPALLHTFAKHQTERNCWIILKSKPSRYCRMTIM